MSVELKILGWTLILAVIQILLPAHLRNQETGVAFNAGPRDEKGPPTGVVTGRLQRAQQNLYETLPLFAAAILAAHVGGHEGSLTFWGAWIYLIARIVYVPLYVAGIPYVRSLVWVTATIGMLMVVAAVLWPG